MLARDKKEYTATYSYGYENVGERRTSFPLQVPDFTQELTHEKTKTKVKAKSGFKFSHLLLILMIFSFATITVARFAVISQNQANIYELKESLEAKKILGEHLKLELASKERLEDVEGYAKAKLNMDFPKDAQVHFVKLPDKSMLAKETELLASQPINEFWNKIISIFN